MVWENPATNGVVAVKVHPGMETGQVSFLKIFLQPGCHRCSAAFWLPVGTTDSALCVRSWLTS